MNDDTLVRTSSVIRQIREANESIKRIPHDVNK
jgi:hypothetical protein